MSATPVANVFWLKLRSWHIVAGNHSGGVYPLACGRTAIGLPNDVRGAGKTCEICLRVAGPK